MVITTVQLHSTKPELRSCASSNPARGVSEIRDGEDRLEIMLNAFRWSTIPQKQFITIIVVKYHFDSELQFDINKKNAFFNVLLKSCLMMARSTT